jgi:type IV pilus assembly protein PilY1
MNFSLTGMIKRTGIAAVGALAISVICSVSNAASLNLSDTPLFLSTSAQPLVMLALSNDEQLYHKAYTDFDDVDGDNLIDTGYKDTIEYYGYFDSKKCYSYGGDAATGNFAPTALAAGTHSHACDTVSGGGRWSGNFLNWASMSRMDALRKVLYGGYRSTDTSTSTILERTYLPSDDHAWTKFYSASDLNRYTPYDVGTYPSGITFCNVTPQGGSTDASETNTTSPRLRVAKGQWTEWAAQELRQCLWYTEFHPTDVGASPRDDISDKIAEFTVRVKVCDASLIGSEKCKTYGTSSKPIGLLHDFADADQDKIRFGLMTGSYGKRKSGGVLRKNVAQFSDEVNASNGTFTGTDGIVSSINRMRISRYYYSAPGYGGADACPPNQNTWNNGTCSNWGNPLSEIYLETLRYFVGKTPNFSSNDNSWIANLKEAPWINPYGVAKTSPANGGGAQVCAKPNVLAISTGVASFDNDEFAGASDISGLNLTTATDAVGAGESINGKAWYVGSLTGGSPNDVCSSKTVSNLSSVTGVCPDAAGLVGSFKIAGLASFAHKSTTALQTISGKAIKPVDTYAVALSSPIPSIKVNVGGTTVTINPAGYQWRDRNAMSLVNFRVISQSADGSQGLFFMNYENAPAGSDYDNDMKGYLRYIVSGNDIKIVMYQAGSSAGATQVMGYTIDGVTDSGTYYTVSNNNLLSNTQQGGATYSTQTIAAIDANCLAAGFAVDPATKANELCHYNNASIASQDRYMRGIKTHTAGAAATGRLQSPLWYAAKWGGFTDSNADGIPQTGEWDSNAPGVPNNYFPVTNAGLLGTQLSTAFTAILNASSSVSSAAVTSGSVNSNSRVYQAIFNSQNWTGQLLSYPVNLDGSPATPEWDASTKMPAAASRSIITINSNGTSAVPFTWSGIDATRKAQLDADATIGQAKLNYLRGDGSLEASQSGGTFRIRPTKLGDIVDSSPIFVGTPPFRYPDSLESAPYSQFATDNATRKGVVYVGANDGMLHAFSAPTGTPPSTDPSAGAELLGFIPGSVFPKLTGAGVAAADLTSQSYTHKFFVDGSPNFGDVFYAGAWHTVLAGGLGKGGQGVYALDITNPANFSESNASGIFKWEFTDANDPEMGYSFSEPSIVKMHNGKWAAVFGNGYNNTDADGHPSTTGHAVLYIVDIQTGTIMTASGTRKGIDTLAGSVASPNGLGTPAVVDLDRDHIADYIFAGDLQGNMWKFDVRDPDPANWNVAYKSGSTPLPIFVAKDSSNNLQPITSRPEVDFGPNGVGMVVLFGTGKYLEQGDKIITPERDQTFYGIYDKNQHASTDIVSGRAVLTQQQITFDFDTTLGGITSHVRVTTSNAVGANRGWYLDLLAPAPTGYQGERVVANVLLINHRVIFPTLIPSSDPCASGGQARLMELNSITGGALEQSPFDLNHDGAISDADLVTAPDGAKHAVSGLGFDENIQTPGIMVDPTGMLNMYESENTTGSGPKLTRTKGGAGKGFYGRQSWRQAR